MPDCARCLTSHDAEQRVMPEGATEAQRNSGATARGYQVDLTSDCAVAPLPLLRSCRALRHPALSGISRSQAFRAVRHPAPSCPAPLLSALFLLARFSGRLTPHTSS